VQDRVRNLAKHRPVIIPQKFIFHCVCYEKDGREIEQSDIELTSPDLPEFLPLKVAK